MMIKSDSGISVKPEDYVRFMTNSEPFDLSKNPVLRRRQLSTLRDSCVVVHDLGSRFIVGEVCLSPFEPEGYTIIDSNQEERHFPNPNYAVFIPKLC